MTLSQANAVAPLSGEQLDQIDAWWRAANYLAVGMIYLQDNPLLSEPLRPEHIKNRLLGHWGSSPGQAFIWAHANRLIRERELDMIYLSGPGHGAPGVLGPTYLDGSYSRSIRISRRMKRACAASSNSFPSRATSVATAHQKPRAPSMRGRAGLRALPRLRRGVRQPEPDRPGLRG